MRFYDFFSMFTKIIEIGFVCSVLITDGCSPVGCVLTQLLKKWGAFVTATCNIRSVPVIQALGKLLKFHFESISVI